jgi:hypothetical protein
VRACTRKPLRFSPLIENNSSGWARTPAVPPRLMLGVAIVAAATVAGAWLAGRRRGHPEIWFAAAAGALLVIAGMHLLPDAWVDAGAARIWPGLVALTAVGAFIATGLVARAGCGCHTSPCARITSVTWRSTSAPPKTAELAR